jgi:acylphosphatase
MAIGQKPKLEQFMHSLMEGPIGSRVEDSVFQWVEVHSKLSGFNILG